jgi:Protein of unknown function (DUF4239)
MIAPLFLGLLYTVAAPSVVRGWPMIPAATARQGWTQRNSAVRRIPTTIPTISTTDSSSSRSNGSALWALRKMGSDNENRDGLAASYIPLDDLLDQPITCDPDFGCVLDDDDGVAYRMEAPFVVGVPAIAPIVAFLTFDYCAKAYRALTEFLSSNKWVAVDGGAYQAKMITPAINGLVVPAIALLFATLTSTTITTLRQRQVDVRRAINMEAGELRAIECLLDAIEAGPVQDQCRDYVRSCVCCDCVCDRGVARFDSSLGLITHTRKQFCAAHSIYEPHLGRMPSTSRTGRRCD